MTAESVTKRAADAFDGSFLSHPAFDILDVEVRERLAHRRNFPEPRELLSLRPVPSKPWFGFELEDAARVRAVGGFDRVIAETAMIPTRSGSFHDLLGGLIWLHFPCLKTAIHRIQLANPGAKRGTREQAATHFDESGVIVASSERSVFQGLAALDWPGVFWERRAVLDTSTRFLAFGHGLLDGLRAPQPKLMGMALFVSVGREALQLATTDFRALLDDALAERLAGFLTAPAQLHPLPVLGIPGWSRPQCAEFYQDEAYFRRARRRFRTPAAPAVVVLGS